jgi:hypothetical protein
VGEQESNSGLAAGGFIDDAKSVLQEVRTSISGLVEAVGANIGEPQEMARRFALEKTLVWRICRVVGSPDTWTAASHIPGRAGLKTFVKALEQAGAPAERAESVRAAMSRFEELIERHSGDRDTFEIMLGGVSDQVARKQSEAFRRMAYLGNSAGWGVQARVNVTVQVLGPSLARPDDVAYGIIGGLVDFRRLRQDVPWPVATRASLSEPGRAQDSPLMEPMDPTVGPSGIPMVREFCSSPLPQMRAVAAPHQGTRYEFTEGPVGHTASATCILGWHSPSVGNRSRYRTPKDQYGECCLSVNTPVETLYHDVYVHRDLNFKLPPRLLIFRRMPGGPDYLSDGQEAGQLPVTEDIIDLGSPPDTMAPGLPRHSQMVTYATDRLGFPTRDFHGYRFCLRYPTVPSAVVFRFELPVGA